MQHAKRQPTAVTTLVPRVLEQLRQASREHQPIDFMTWKRLLGPTRARQAQPASLRRGVLTIHVAHPSLLYELSFERPQLLKALQRLLPERTIEEVSVRIGEVRW